MADPSVTIVPGIDPDAPPYELVPIPFARKQTGPYVMISVGDNQTDIKIPLTFDPLSKSLLALNAFEWPPMDSPATIEALFDWLKTEHDVPRVYWRGAQSQLMRDYGCVRRDNVFYAELHDWYDYLDRELRVPRSGKTELVGYNEIAIAEAHKRGMQIYALEALFDHGSVGGAGAAGVFPWVAEEKLRLERPEFCSIDRWGERADASCLEFCYPEVRKALVDRYVTLLDDQGYDGILFSTYIENYSFRYIEEFGFNGPIIDEFNERLRRAGGSGDLLTIARYLKWERSSLAVPDLFDWHAEWGGGDKIVASKALFAQVRGDFLTMFFRELHDALGELARRKGERAKRLAVKLRRDRPDDPEVLTFRHPYKDGKAAETPHAGLIRMDWRAWVDRGIVDELVVQGSFYDAALIWDTKNKIFEGPRDLAGKPVTSTGHSRDKLSDIEDYVSRPGTLRVRAETVVLRSRLDITPSGPSDHKARAAKGEWSFEALQRGMQVSRLSTFLSARRIVELTTDANWKVRLQALADVAEPANNDARLWIDDVDFHSALRVRVRPPVPGVLDGEPHVLVRRQAMITVGSAALQPSNPSPTFVPRPAVEHPQWVERVGWLESGLKDPEHCVRVAAAVSLAHVHGIRSAREIIEELGRPRSQHFQMKVACEMTLSELCISRVPGVAAESIRRVVAGCYDVAEVPAGSPWSVPAGAISSTKPTTLRPASVRHVCARALALLGGAVGERFPDGWRPLVHALKNDPDLGVKYYAIIGSQAVLGRGLSKWGYRPEVAYALVAALEFPGESRGAIGIRLAAARAFADMGPRALDRVDAEAGEFSIRVKAFVLGALKRRFDSYGEDCTALDAEYGWRTVGLALLAMEDRAFLEGRLASSPDMYLARAAYEVLFVPQSPESVDIVRAGEDYSPDPHAGFLLQPYDKGERLAVERHNENAPEAAPLWRREAPCATPPVIRRPLPEFPEPEPAWALGFEALEGRGAGAWTGDAMPGAYDPGLPADVDADPVSESYPWLRSER